MQKTEIITVLHEPFLGLNNYNSAVVNYPNDETNFSNIDTENENAEWLLYEDANPNYLYCLYCDINVQRKTYKQHSSSMKHKDNCDNFLAFRDEEGRLGKRESLIKVKNELGIKSRVEALKQRRKSQVESLSTFNWIRWKQEHNWLERDVSGDTIGICKYCRSRLNVANRRIRERHSSTKKHKEAEKRYNGRNGQTLSRRRSEYNFLGFEDNQQKRAFNEAERNRRRSTTTMLRKDYTPIQNEPIQNFHVKQEPWLCANPNDSTTGCSERNEQILLCEPDINDSEEARANSSHNEHNDHSIMHEDTEEINTSRNEGRRNSVIEDDDAEANNLQDGNNDDGIMHEDTDGISTSRNELRNSVTTNCHPCDLNVVELNYQNHLESIAHRRKVIEVTNTQEEPEPPSAIHVQTPPIEEDYNQDNTNRNNSRDDTAAEENENCNNESTFRFQAENENNDNETEADEDESRREENSRRKENGSHDVEAGEEEEEQESSSKSSSSINSNEQEHENIEKTNMSVNDRSSSNSKLLKRTFCLTEKRSNVYQPSKRYRIDTSFVRRKTEASSQSESKVIRRKSNLQRNEEKDSYDLFFQSMSVVTKNLPPKLAIEAKSKVMSIMAEIELRAINEREVLEDKDK